MITLTPAAAKQVVIAARANGSERLALRLAAKRRSDGSMEYGMGFDEMGEEDLAFNCEGIEVVLHPNYEPLLQGTVIDFVEYQPNDYRFIFMNPNDANFSPPSEE